MESNRNFSFKIQFDNLCPSKHNSSGDEMEWEEENDEEEEAGGEGEGENGEGKSIADMVVEDTAGSQAS